MRYKPKYTPKDEKYTPIRYIQTVKKVLGKIDLDLFSSFEANQRIGATHIYTNEISAFARPWLGRCFANPPYGRGFLVYFTDYALKEYLEERTKEAIFLLPSNTDQSWFHKLLKMDLPVCLTDHRINFIDGIRFTSEYKAKLAMFPSMIDDVRGKLLTNPENGSAFFYLGKNPMKFALEFERYGSIINVVPKLNKEKEKSLKVE